MMTTSRENSDRDAEESAFLRNVDSILEDRLQDSVESLVAKKRLKERTQFEDNKLIDELTKLGVTEDSLIAMRAVPIVMVAWSSGKVSEAERKSAMVQAINAGVRGGSVAAVLVEHWLKRKPPLMIVDAYKRYIHAELGKISEEEKQERIKRIEERMMSVAKVSGGHFGFAKVSQKEHQMIEMMRRLLRE
jgi:hypothetical protein